MAIIKTINGFTPQFGRNPFIADQAVVVGDVIMGDDCNVIFRMARLFIAPIRQRQHK
jgi:carbonic anhydrase/acetyltransferase-like protein (isoleucine patch superfamily)